MTLIGTKDAETFRLRPTGETAKLRGLGHGIGHVCLPINVSVGTCSVPVTLCIIQDELFPLLLGSSALADLNVLIDPVKRSLVDRGS